MLYAIGIDGDVCDAWAAVVSGFTILVGQYSYHIISYCLSLIFLIYLLLLDITLLFGL